jgi:hypothetical protein
MLRTSVGDPDLELDPEPHVFGSPGSGSISQRCGSRSGFVSFHFLINAMSGLKYCLQNKMLIQNFSKKLIFFV